MEAVLRDDSNLPGLLPKFLPKFRTSQLHSYDMFLVLSWNQTAVASVLVTSSIQEEAGQFLQALKNILAGAFNSSEKYLSIGMIIPNIYI